MKFAPGRRRSIRYSIFIGVLAGSVFSGSGAFGIDLASISERVAANDNIALDANAIYTAGDPSGPSFQGSTYFGTYTGILSGNGATITGLTVPLFDTISNEVKDLNLATAPCVSGVCGVAGRGALANTLGAGGTVDNVDVTGHVNGDGYEEVGGLVGRLESGATITDSHTTSNQDGSGVSGFVKVGGLVGYSEGSIETSTASGPVSGVGYIEDSENEYIGGLVGVLQLGATITDSNASGYVDGGLSVGGLVGLSQGAITDSHATGGVEGESNIGGLAGYSAGEITNSHAIGNVTGTGEYIGGLVGWLGFEGSISNSYANTGTVTGTGTDEEVFDEFGEIIDHGDHGIGGLVGYSSGYISDSRAEGNVDGFYQVGGLVGSTGVASYITNSYATGEVTGRDEIGGLVGRLDDYHEITNSYATGDVTGDDDIGGLVGNLQEWASITNSYATGDVTGTVEFNGGDIGGLVGYSQGLVTNTHATGDVTGVFDVGGLVGDLQPSGEIRNSYATGNVRANGSDGGWTNGWGGLVGEFSGLIENSFATGNVVADYNAGALVGYSYAQGEEVVPLIVNSFATGEVSDANNDVVFDEESIAPEDWQQGLGGFVGCKESYDIELDAYSCALASKEFPELNQETILSVVNTVDDGDESEFEIVACKNNGLPSLSELIDSYENTCVTPSGSNRERRIRDFIPTTAITEIAKALGFVISPKFPNDASIGFIKNEKELAISKILGAQKAADRVAWTSMKTGEALQISYNFDSKDPIELWVKLPDGKWILAGVINFDKNGKAVLPPKQFKVAGEYVLVLNKPSEESVKANAPLNQIGSLTVFVN